MKKNDKANKNKNKALIFGRYKILKQIDEGSFGKVYLGLNVKKKEKVAIKLENKSSPLQFLEAEAFFLYLLRGIGIPKIETYGHNEKYNILVETLLGNSLKDLFLQKKKNFTIKDVLMIGIQMIERLQFVHSKNIIHRDIKPENFLIGYTDPYLIYLIDFGLCKKFRSNRTGKHVNFSISKRITGTANYSSLNSLRGYQVSRRDDLESIAYILIYLMKGSLPWENIQTKKKSEKYNLIFKFKLLISPETLCENIPEEICEFLKYCRNLKFEQEPNYEYCCSLFNSALLKIGANNDLVFSWIKDKSILNKLKKMNNKAYHSPGATNRFRNFGFYDISKRKSSPQTRIYHSIQNSIEKKKLNKLSRINNTLNDINFGDIYSSENYLSIDLNERKNNALKLIKKIPIKHGKINSLLTNESSNINFKDNNSNNNYEKENKALTFKIFSADKYIEKNNPTPFSERINYNVKNNLDMEKSAKLKLGTNFIKNKINYENSNETLNNEINNPFQIKKELKSLLLNFKKIKLNNFEKNFQRNNIQSNISKTINANHYFNNMENKNNMKGLKIKEIPNNDKSKNNYKTISFNIQDNNNNIDLIQVNKSLKNNNKNQLQIFKNRLKLKKKIKNLKKINFNKNDIQKRNQLSIKKLKLKYLLNSKPNNNIINNSNIYCLNPSIDNNKNSINSEMRNNYLTPSENRRKSNLNIISFNSENTFNFNNTITISNKREKQAYNNRNIYYTNPNISPVFNNSRLINKNNKEKIKKKNSFNALNINKKNLCHIKLKLKQKEIINNNIKKMSNYITYNNNINEIKSNKNKIMNFNNLNNLKKFNLNQNAILKNNYNRNNNYNKNSFSSRLIDLKLANQLSLNNTDIYNNSYDKSSTYNNDNYISNETKKHKMFNGKIIRNYKNRNDLNYHK